MFKHSYTVEGRTYTACIECERGINGTAKNKCSSGGNETDSRLGCWLGEPMGIPQPRYSWKVTGGEGNKINLMYIDHMTGHDDNILVELNTPDDAKRAMAYGYVQNGICPYFDFWHMRAKKAPKPKGTSNKTLPGRIQRKRTKGWRMADQSEGKAVYVGRPTKWGNPYKPGDLLGDVAYLIVKKAGYEYYPVGLSITAEMAVGLYRAYAKLSDLDFTELAGFDVACWCGLDNPCHGDVVLELANE